MVTVYLYIVNAICFQGLTSHLQNLFLVHVPVLWSPPWISWVSSTWYAVPVRETLCLFVMRYARSRYPVSGQESPAWVTIRCAFSRNAVPVPITVTGFLSCLLLLETEFWPWARFISPTLLPYFMVAGFYFGFPNFPIVHVLTWLWGFPDRYHCFLYWSIL